MTKQVESAEVSYGKLKAVLEVCGKLRDPEAVFSEKSGLEIISNNSPNKLSEVGSSEASAVNLLLQKKVCFEQMIAADELLGNLRFSEYLKNLGNNLERRAIGLAWLENNSKCEKDNALHLKNLKEAVAKKKKKLIDEEATRVAAIEFEKHKEVAAKKRAEKEKLEERKSAAEEKRRADGAAAFKKNAPVRDAAKKTLEGSDVKPWMLMEVVNRDIDIVTIKPGTLSVQVGSAAAAFLLSARSAEDMLQAMLTMIDAIIDCGRDADYIFTEGKWNI